MRLVENLKRDGVLTSAPLVHRQGDTLTVLSGNHRVAAGIRAGIIDADVIEVIGELTRKRLVALQLSHNAIVGEDDPATLRSLYDELDFGWKEYSGLTDDAFAVDQLDMSVLRVEAPFYEELHISFLPADAGIFTEWLMKIGKSEQAQRRMVGLYQDFDVFFETLVKVKRAQGVTNTAVALRIMAELAGKALASEPAAEAPVSKRAAHAAE